MPHHSMTLSRHQDKLLQTPATLETLGSTSAVPLHRLEAWKAACVNSWIHRHGPACGKEFVSELSCRNHACRTTGRAATTLSARILSLPRQANRELLATNSKKDRSWLQTRSQNLLSKMKPFLASPNETIEAGLPEKLKLKMTSVERDTNCPNRKEMPRRQKKRSPNECARQPFYRCSHNRGVCQHKVPFFNQRSTRLSSCVIMPESKIIHRFFLYHVGTEEVQSLVSRIIIFSEA